MNWPKKLKTLSLSLCIVMTCGANAGSADNDENIRKRRMGELIVEAQPGAVVRVEQIRHEFWFGAAISSSVFGGGLSAEDQRKYKETFLANFNSAVTENALKWHAMESRKGVIDYSVLDAMLEWTDANEIPLRGHNIFWGIPGRVQGWLKEMNDDDLHQALEIRATTIGKRFKGRFAQYDLNNEMIHGNYYADRLGQDITKKMADWVKQADPDAQLYLNDYDILTGNRLDDYMKHIQTLREKDVPIAGIGVQGHLHGDSFDPVKLRGALDELAKTGLPVCVTEFNFPGQRSKVYNKRSARLTPEQEEDKAKAITDYYRVCFEHPAVEGILMWGFWERANWIPQSSLYRQDWSPTPAAKAYRDLIFKEWWTRREAKADQNGICRISAFYGQHRVIVGAKEKTINLKKSLGKATVSFNVDGS